MESSPKSKGSLSHGHKNVIIGKAREPYDSGLSIFCHHDSEWCGKPGEIENCEKN
jgi:hypothetical protein